MLSSPWEMRLPLRWVAILYGRVPVDLAITSGVHTAEDVVKGVMAGANVTMMTSALLQERRRPHRPDRRAKCRAGWKSTSTSRSSRCRAA